MAEIVALHHLIGFALELPVLKTALRTFEGATDKVGCMVVTVGILGLKHNCIVFKLVHAGTLGNGDFVRNALGSKVLQRRGARFAVAEQALAAIARARCARGRGRAKCAVGEQAYAPHARARQALILGRAIAAVDEVRVAEAARRTLARRALG